MHNLDPFNSYTFPTIVDALMNEDASGGPICKVAFSASGLFLAAACPARSKDYCWQLSVWDLTTGGAAVIAPIPARLTGQQPSLISLVWDQNVLLLAFSNCHLVLYDCQRGRFMLRKATADDPGPLVVRGKDDADELLDVSLTVLDPGSGRRSWTFVFRGGRIQTLSGERLRAVIEEGADAVILPDDDQQQNLSPILCLATGQRHFFLASAEPTNHLRIVDRQSGAEWTLALEIASTQILSASAAADAMLLGLIMRDKTIRILDVDVEGGGTIRQRHKLQDAVNRWSWAACGFSNDSELIWGAVNASDTHLIYVWEAKSGALVRMLEGPRDELVTAVWDPRRPSLISATSLGRLLRWVPEYPVKWCAMVPGLEEITENVEYVEREDEFDLTVQVSLETQQAARARLGQAQETERIQVHSHPGIWPSECVRLLVACEVKGSDHPLVGDGPVALSDTRSMSQE